MIRRIAIACAALMLASPALSQTESTLLQTIRDFGNATAGQDAGDGGNRERQGDRPFDARAPHPRREPDSRVHGDDHQ